MSVQWSNEQPPPPRKMSGTARFLIGCGVLSLLGVATCGGLLLFGAGKVASLGDDEWKRMRAITAGLQTDAGAEQVWAQNPGLAGTFTSQDDFLREVRQLRPALEPLPEKRPDLMSGQFSINSRSYNGETRVEAAWLNSKGQQQLYAFRNGQLTSVAVRAAPARPAPEAH